MNNNNLKTSSYCIKALVLLLIPFAVLQSITDVQAETTTQKFCSKATFQSESMSSDRKKGISIAKGNVELCNDSFIIRSESLTIEKPAEETRQLDASGNPVFFKQKHSNGVLTATTSRLILDETSSIAQLLGSTELTIPANLKTNNSSEIQINANQLKMKYQNNASGVNGVWLKSTGNPVKINILSDGITTQLSANKAHFDFDKRLLTLSENAYLRDETIELTAGELIFDLSNQSWTAPQNSEQRVTIKQRFGDSK